MGMVRWSRAVTAAIPTYVAIPAIQSRSKGSTSLPALSRHPPAGVECGHGRTNDETRGAASLAGR
jgi:hypothetical protein